VIVAAMTGNRWLGVELRHLAALAAVRRSGSFRGAADDLGYVQSAVSQQIAKLERVVGIRLVERTRGHSDVHLTDAGAVLLDHAEAILARLHEAQTDLARIGDRREEILRVGLHESVAAQLLPGVMPRFASRSPGVDVTAVSVADSSDAARGVAVGELDVAFDQLPLTSGPFEYYELLHDPCVLVVQADCALARRNRRPSLTELASLPLIEHSAWRLTSQLGALLPEPAGGPRFVQRSSLDSVVQVLVAAGVGAAVMPSLAVDSRREDITTIDLTGLLPPLRVALFWHRDRRSEAVDTFCAAALEACAGGTIEVGAEPPAVAA
jgi:DNA-binding transcriptional LysR family regulator